MKINLNYSKLIQFTSTVSLVAYTCTLLYLTVFQRLLRGSVTGMFLENYKLNLHDLRFGVNLIPFKTISGYLSFHQNANIVMTNLGGNIIAFLPLGFLVPLVFKRIDSYKKVLLTSFVASVLIEIIQMLLNAGSTDIDDVILNTFGGSIGYFTLYLFLRIFRKPLSKQVSKEEI